MLYFKTPLVCLLCDIYISYFLNFDTVSYSGTPN